MPKYKFGDLVYNITEKRSPVAGDEELYIGLEHLDSGSLRVTRWGSKVALKGDKLVMRKGDILFGRRNTYLRRVAIAPHDGLFSAHGMILRAKTERINCEYLPFFIASDYFMDEAIRISVGSLSPTVNWKELKELEFTIPTLEAQEKLTKTLIAANDLKEKYEELLAITDDLVKSQFIELFGDPELVLKSTHTVSEVADVQVGIVIKPTRFYADGVEGTKAFRSLNVGTMCVNDADWVYFSDDAMKETQRTVARTGDVLIVRSGNPGTSCVVTPEYDGCNVIDLIIAHPIKDKILPEYLCAFTNYPHGMNQIIGQQRGVAQKHFNVGLYNQMKIILPTLEEQRRFVAILKQTDKSKFEIKKAIENTSALIKSLMQQDLTN